MRPRAALIACLLPVLAAACGGDGNGDESRLLVRSSFQEVVVAELRGEEYEAEPAPDFGVLARQGPNRVALELAGPFADYEAEPEREDEIVQGVVEEARAALEEGIATLSLDDVRDEVMPLLKAHFELRSYGFEPAQTEFPGRLAVVYAVDREDEFTLVRPQDVERWGTTLQAVHELALGNLLRQTNEEEPLLCEPSGGQVLCGWSSGDGYDAARMLVPELRAQIVAEVGGPAAYAAPMENVFIALGRSVLERGRTEELFRVKLQRDFQTSDDPLSPEIFVERGGELALLP